MIKIHVNDENSGRTYGRENLEIQAEVWADKAYLYLNGSDI